MTGCLKKAFLFLFLSLFFRLPAETPWRLEEWIGREARPFRTVKAGTFLRQGTPESFLFQWSSGKKNEARYPAFRNSPPVTFCGFTVPEILLMFEQEDLVRITVCVYNRGDMGRITKENFNEILEEVESYFNTLTRAACRESRVLISGGSFQQKKWALSEEISVTIRYALSGKSKAKTSEYIQVIYEKENRSGSSTPGPSGEACLKNLRKEADGTVFIDNIPMVDQGQKGYCAVAVAERVMRYYGNENIDQHVMAQLAKTQDGTSMELLEEALAQVARKFKLHFRKHYQVSVENFKDAEKVLKRYNAFARKMKKPKIEFVVHHRVIDWPATVAAMDPEVFRRMRLSEKAERDAFFKNVRSYVDRGIPLLWGVTLGIVPEKARLMQTRGGHLRLIIGYNELRKEIVFSDTWGPGHEKKSLSDDDAWVITTHLSTLEP